MEAAQDGNVKIEVSGTTEPLPIKYVDGNSSGNATGVKGQALVFNVPVDAGALSLTATPMGFGKPYALIPYVFVQAGTETLLGVSPNQ